MELLWHQTQAPQLQKRLLFLRPPLLLRSQSAWICFVLFLLTSPTLFSASLSLSVFHLVELLCASMNRCNNTFLRSLRLTLCFWLFLVSFYWIRQPPRSPGKVSFAPQRKSPSSMITRAYHKTLDKCQRGLRGGDPEDIWRRDPPPPTWHTHIPTQLKVLARSLSHTHTAPCMKQRCLKQPNRAEEFTEHHTQHLIFMLFVWRLTYLFSPSSSP